jgi:hypothetical protein
MAFWPSSQLSQAHVKLRMEISSRWPQLFIRLMQQPKVHAILGGSVKAKQHGNRGSEANGKAQRALGLAGSAVPHYLSRSYRPHCLFKSVC